MARNVEEKKNAIPIGAARQQDTPTDFHDGNVMSVSGDTLVIATLERREYSFSVAADASICCDGINCKIDEVPIASRIRLTTKPGTINVAAKIEALNNQGDFADMK